MICTANILSLQTIYSETGMQPNHQCNPYESNILPHHKCAYTECRTSIKTSPTRRTSTAAGQHLIFYRSQWTISHSEHIHMLYRQIKQSHIDVSSVKEQHNDVNSWKVTQQWDMAGAVTGVWKQASDTGSVHVQYQVMATFEVSSYLLRAFSISMVTKTDRAIVIGSGAWKILQSTPLNILGSAGHCMWWVWGAGKF